MRVLQVFLALLLASAAVAQDVAPPAHIAFVEGSAVVYHAGDDSEPAVINMPLVQGDRLQTMERARVEVMFPDGAIIAIDPESDVEFVTATRVRVLAGGIEHRTAQTLDPRSPSTQNLPPDLQPYVPDFDQNGAWQYEPQYGGNVWYPTTVSADWRPYYDGYWSSYPSYGWTWVGYERWAWPTHHYGRWGYARSRWFWIPGRSFAAAWVSWGTAPDYVSWCPLGYDGRPVVGLSIGFRNSWNAWTVIPRDRFGARGYSARRYAVEPQRVAASSAFIEHRTQPAPDRRRSFGASPNTGDGRRAIGDPNASRTVGTAVPRGEYRVPSGEYRRRVDAVQPEQGVTTSDRRDTVLDRRAPGPGQRVPSGDGRAPSNERHTTSGEPRAPGNRSDHPAYQPPYQPRYEPRYEPTSTAPRGEPAYRERRSGGEGRVTTPESRPSAQPRRETREVAPAPAAAPPPPPAAARGDGSSSRGGERPSTAPAREPHPSGRDERTQERPSAGTAVRRPR